ncbi:MAG: cysteine desulfurase family protein [Deltaproteobacteria bacterium]|nr:cysteine desulfurase family protein [Deltaproteobacteria bacterium]
MRIGQTIYLDHQATTPLDERVLAEMAPYHRESFGNPHSSDHCLGWQAAHAVEQAAARVARLIGADPDEIFFTSGATESNNMALLGLGRRATGGSRHRILVSAIEHKCVLASARALEEHFAFSVEQIPVDRQGHINLAVLEGMLGEDVLATSVMAVNNEIGTIQDILTISSLVRNHGAVFHCDAAQAPMSMSIGGLAAHADLLSLSGHKMYGPKGVGVAFIARSLQDRIEPLIYGGGQQGGLRSGTLPVPICVGMGAAAHLLNSEEAEGKCCELRRRRDDFVRRLTGLNWPIWTVGPRDVARHPANASICFHGFIAHEILGALQPRLAASTGSACTSGIPESSHVLKAIGLGGDDAEATVRFSLGFGTTDDDVEQAIALIKEVLVNLSKVGLMRSA